MSVTSRITRKRVVVAAMVALLLVGGAAFAAWLVSGTGEGRAKAGSLSALTVSAGTLSPAKVCFPGQTCDGSFKITNPNAALVIVNTAPGDGSGSSPPTCPISNLMVNSLSGLTIPLPSGTTDNLIIPDVYTLKASAPTECQGANLTLSVQVNATTP